MLLSMYFPIYLYIVFFHIAHASFKEYWRERSLHLEFYFLDGWNRMTNFQCRSLACGVYMILINQV
jgi:hypothetical protein